MRNTQKDQYCFFISPEEQLRQLSFAESVQKLSIESPKMSKLQNQKFTIDSWDISQKLKPCQKQNSRYKDTLSTNLTSSLNKCRFRAKSAVLKKDIQCYNSHNFNIRIKSGLNAQDTKIKFLFSNKSINDLQKKKNFNQTSKQFNVSRKTSKSKKTIQRLKVEQNQCRVKTISSYFTHRKQQIKRQRQLILSQRTGKQQLNIFEYPIGFKNVNKNKNYISQNINKKFSKARVINPENNQFNLNLQQHINSTRQSIDYQNCSCRNSHSPIKRFQIFQEGLNKVQIN